MSGFFKKMSNFFQGKSAVESEEDVVGSSETINEAGFKVQKQVEVVREPVISAAGYAGGGIQGLWWYVKSLWEDADGNVAEEFYVEQTSSVGAIIETILQVVPAVRPAVWSRIEIVNGDIIKI
mmetsp:Transcript_7748/g.10469  ORF Transcript_7748/g.10469 Transcript_7748/m.10469 type:complete len:123 (-) Transcript_7748:397-765(-)|eukprot:CAMPEP_0196588462 /NCGR_PEP_ID=MMETSP1081-20130531/60592_1 /TAXON_ID=36882 /ORGANISM="Pyramimonas amylifera, Strain CCMP720" /LENGTH=122 /DNA_ID=CAMNT_0041910961 /DNA_START=133 /DNA_END=501 /DNA_ORIENTATION=+